MQETAPVEAQRIARKAELRRKGMSYADLAEALGTIGVEANEKMLNNKIARGGFSAAFLMQCLDVIGAKTVQIGD